MQAKPPLVLIGRLFGESTDKLRLVFELTQADDFGAFAALPDSLLESLRAASVGMVGAGHISHTAVDDEFFRKLPNLQLLACLGAGCEFVDMDAARMHGVTVTNTPGINTEETADTAMGLLLGVVRQLPQADRYLRDGRWPGGMFPLTGTLRGKRLGILGLGNIGKAVARRAEAFGLEVLYHGRNEQRVKYRYVATPRDLAHACDILMAVVPGGDETRHMVDARVLEALGSDGILINISRGTVVDERALIKALRNRVIHSAAVDAFENEPHAPPELIEMEHVMLTPHIGSGTHYTRAQMAQGVTDNLLAWAKGQPLPSPMD